ncbi:hypothetical protein GCM10027514_44210 [Azotobacter armeniacus]
MKFVFGTHIDDELVGQAIDFLGFDLLHGCLAAAGDLPVIAPGRTGIGAIILAQRFDATDGGLEKRKIVIGHGLASAKGI